MASDVGAAASRVKRSAEDFIAIGQDLIAAKEQLSHGAFLPWVTAEFEMGQATAYNFIHVAERFGGELTTVVNIAPKVLYLLAAPSTPDTVIERVTSGEVAPTRGGAANLTLLEYPFYPALHSRSRRRSSRAKNCDGWSANYSIFERSFPVHKHS